MIPVLYLDGWDIGVCRKPTHDYSGYDASIEKK